MRNRKGSQHCEKMALYNATSRVVPIISSLCCALLLFTWTAFHNPSRRRLFTFSDNPSAVIPTIKTASDQNSSSNQNFTSLSTDNQSNNQERLLRHAIANLSIDMMLEFYENENNPNRSIFVDITPLVALIETALDTLGVRTVLTSFIEMHSFAGALSQELELRGMSNEFNLQVIDKTNSNGPQPFLDYKDRNNNCNGCLWWHWHYVGAVIGDKLLRDRFLLISKDSNETIIDALSFVKELRNIQRSENPDNIVFHVQHGFLWTYVITTMPDLDEYPIELAHHLCGDLISKDEPVETRTIRKNDVGRDCRHSFGHALFYVMATKDLNETKGISNLPVTTQFRPDGGFQLRESTICRAYEMCSEGAINQKLYGECVGAFRHSQGVISAPITGSETPIELRRSEKKACERKLGKSLGYNKKKFG